METNHFSAGVHSTLLEKLVLKDEKNPCGERGHLVEKLGAFRDGPHRLRIFWYPQTWSSCQLDTTNACVEENETRQPVEAHERTINAVKALSCRRLFCGAKTDIGRSNCAGQRCRSELHLCNGHRKERRKKLH